MVFNVTIVIVLGTKELIKVCVLPAPWTGHSPVSLPLARHSYSLRYNNIVIRTVNILAESEEELKSLSMKVNEENEKGGLKLNIQKTKIMLSDPITSWEIDGETMETVKDFIFLGSQITADGDCSHEIKNPCSLEEKL